MKTQPQWRLVANIGDRDPFERGRLVYVDATNVYSPEMVYFDPPVAGKVKLHRFSMRACTLLNDDPSTLSDNRYHADKPAWFTQYIEGVASFGGTDAKELANKLCSSSPVERALAYDLLVSYFGIDEFDSYPVIVSPSFIRRKYRAAFTRKA